MLHDFTIPTKTIEYKGSPVLDVRGLSFNDISYLILQHRDDVDKLVTLWDAYSQRGGFSEMKEAVIIQYGFELLREAPGILAHVIAVAADAHESFARIAKLPSSVQIDALKAIGNMTIEDFGGAKKMLETLWTTVLAHAPDQVRNSVEPEVQ